MLRIKVLIDDDSPCSAVVKQLPFTIGRSLNSDLILDDPTVSAAHARIESIEGEFFLIDAGSTNGILSDGERAERVRLHHGLKLRCGRVELAFELEQERKQTLKIDPLFTSQLGRKPRDSAWTLLAALGFCTSLPVLVLAATTSSSYLQPDWTNVMVMGASSTAALLLLASLAALFSKIQCRSYNFSPLYALTMIVPNAAYLLLLCLFPFWGHLPWVSLHDKLYPAAAFLALVLYFRHAGLIIWPGSKPHRVAFVSFTVWTVFFTCFYLIRNFSDNTPATTSKIALAYPVHYLPFGTRSLAEFDAKLTGLEDELIKEAAHLREFR
ncbi:MAG TPA: FHA domain-containing protein [Oligoflexia bacterium]|nr:FHA domain-containing protein [Oligoflexia bacterium]